MSLLQNVSIPGPHALMVKSLLAFGARVAGALISLALTIILPHLLPLSDVGIVYLGISIAMVLSAVQRFGLDYTALNVALEPTTGEVRAVDTYAKSLIMFFSVGTLIWPVTYASMYLGHEFFDLPDSVPRYIFLLWSTGLAINLILFQMYKAAGRTTHSVLTRNFYYYLVVCFYLLACLALDYRPNLIDVLAAFSFSVLLVALANSLFFFSTEPGKVERIRSRDFKIWFKKSPPFFTYSLAMICFNEIDIWIVSAVLPHDQTAIYATAKRLMLLVSIFFDIANIVLPRRLRDTWKNGSKAEVELLMRRTAAYFFMLSLLVVAIVAAFAPIGIELVFPDELSVAYGTLMILLMAQSANLLLGFGETLLVMKGMQNKLILSALMGIIVNVVISVILSPRWGINGVAVAFLVSAVFYRGMLAREVKASFGISTVAGRFWK